MLFREIKENPGLLPPGRSRDLIPMNCSHCGEAFHVLRGEVAKALKRGRSGVYCSRTCGGKGPRSTSPTGSDTPQEFQTFQKNPSILQQFKWSQKITLSCSVCGRPHHKKRAGVWQALQKKQEGMYCSPTCQGVARSARSIVVIEGEQGRICKVCDQWHPLKKMMSNGKANTCFTCWPKRPQQLYYRYKRGASKRGYAFVLTFNEFMAFWQVPCVYCGEDIQYLGIDRRDNTKGYVKGNVVSCCTRCNEMKMADTVEDFISRCRKIVALYDEQAQTVD